MILVLLATYVCFILNLQQKRYPIITVLHWILMNLDSLTIPWNTMIPHFHPLSQSQLLTIAIYLHMSLSSPCHLVIYGVSYYLPLQESQIPQG